MAGLKAFQMSGDWPPERRPQIVAGAIAFLLSDRSRNHGHAP
jgi:hypothetical protein